MLLWLAGMALLAAAADLRDPLFLPVRVGATIGIVTASCVAIALVLWRGRHRGFGLATKLLLALWLGVPVLIAGETAVFQLHRRSVFATDGADARDLGQHFIVGYTKLADIKRLAARGLIGGVFLTRRNVEGRTIDAVRDEIAELQQSRRLAGLPPLIIATDQEGGIVSHFSPPLERLPALATLAALPPERRSAAARDYGMRQGRELADLGVTLNLAPVVDLQVQRSEHGLDLYSHIEQRAISADPDVAGDIAAAYAEGLERSGIKPTLKHFPGLGGVSVDTHLALARLATPTKTLAARDWLPFREVIAHSSAYLMVGHVVLSDIDPDRPASQSSAVIQGVLRVGWGYAGILVTDDLTMAPIYRRGICRSVVAALNAGMDLLLVSYDGDQFFPAMDCALSAARAGRVDAARLEQSRARLEINRAR